MKARFRFAPFIALLAAACSVDPWGDREGTTVRDIAVDSLRFMPLGGRFVLKDSAAPIAFLGYHAGYLCAKILEMGVRDIPVGEPPAFLPSTRVRLPGNPDCAFDSGGRDTTVPHAFSGGSVIRLANSGGTLTDSALLVSGTMAFDSARGALGVAGTFTSGHFTYREASTLAPGLFFADSLPPCVRLNHADFEKNAKGDTVMVRYSWVTLDGVSAPGGCAGPAEPDSVAVAPHRPLRH
jgi:hypothetical protein